MSNVHETSSKSSYGVKNISKIKSSDLVATWEVSLSDGVYIIQFEHGTTTGKRVLYVNGEEVKKANWKFKLVGNEEFEFGRKKHKGKITIEACSGFAYEYTLTVDGSHLNKFQKNKDKATKSWTLLLDESDRRIVLEKDSLDVWCNGEKLETAGEFSQEGCETHFVIDNHRCFIRALSSGNKRDGVIHTLHVDGRLIPDPPAS